MMMMKSWRSINFFVAAAWLWIGVNGDIILVDTSIDLYERDNVANESSFAGILAECQERYEFFKSVDVTIDFPDFEGANPIWDAAGCIVPLDGDYDVSDKPVIEVGVPLDNAPNIVLMLFDDVGLNDLSFGGVASTWLNSATPNMQALAANGISLTNHYSCWVCGPARGSLMTGRYAYRLGYGRTPLIEVNLPVDQITIAEELKPYGYRTHAIGKWHLGLDTWYHTPTFRGFDNFYGYYFGAVGYYDKNMETGYFDLHNNEECVSNETEVGIHLTTLLQSKAESAIEDHVSNFPDLRLFLYYATQNMHSGPYGEFEAPDEYMNKCNITSIDTDASFNDTYFLSYCALVVMLDEAVGNTVCALEKAGIADNTLMIVANDNGGWKFVPGVSYPYRGTKGSFLAGGMKTRLFLYAPSSIIPEQARNTTYDGLVHITDWFPTIMSLASSGEWSSSVVLDGVDVFNSIITNTTSNRTEIFINYDSDREMGGMQIGNVRFIEGTFAFGTSPEATLGAESTESSCSSDY